MLSIKLTIDAYFDVLANYEAACKGDPEAIQSIIADTIINVVAEVVTASVSSVASNLAEKYLKKAITNEFSDARWFDCEKW